MRRTGLLHAMFAFASAPSNCRAGCVILLQTRHCWPSPAPRDKGATVERIATAHDCASLQQAKYIYASIARQQANSYLDRTLFMFYIYIYIYEYI